jgi:predicted Na+-dependent transporter
LVLGCFILFPLVYRDALLDVILNGWGLLVLVLYLPIAIGAGWWLGGPDADKRRLLALCCGQGSMGAAFVIASHSFNNAHVIAMLLLILWVSLAVLVPLVLVFRRQGSRLPAALGARALGVTRRPATCGRHQKGTASRHNSLAEDPR